MLWPAVESLSVIVCDWTLPAGLPLVYCKVGRASQLTAGRAGRLE